MAFDKYAQFYDIFYKRKSYARECDYLSKIFKKFSKNKPKTILDLGCGTGNHMLPLLKRGFSVFGVDRSAAMLKVAKAKISGYKNRSDLRQGTLDRFHFSKKFDAAICMFSVINYVTERKALAKTLKNVYQHMTPGGLFVFDFWNAPAVEVYYSPTKKRTFYHGKQTLERASVSTVISSKRLCKVHYTCTLSEGKKVLQRFHEQHVLRYFDLQEMKNLLQQAGFQVLHVHPFLSMSGRIQKNTWDVTIVARKN